METQVRGRRLTFFKRPLNSMSQTHLLQAPLRCKTGIFTYDDGSIYEGEFEDGKVHGQGTYTWSDGTMYDGRRSRTAFRDGAPARLTWPERRDV